jgi:hypothetical protein
MITLINPALWQARIESECPIFDGRVLETLDDDALALDFIGMPAVLIYLTSDSSEPSPLVNLTRQKHSYVMAIKIAIRKTSNKTDRLSSADSSLIRTCRLELMQALVGWTPSDCDAAIEHIGGSLSKKDDLYFWTDEFAAFDYLRN